MKKNILACALVLFLAACNSAPKPEMPCPEAGLMPNADVTLVRKDTSAGFDASNVAVKARFGNYRGACKIARQGGIDYTLEMDIMVSKPVADQGPAVQKLPYFIAVLSPDEQILSRNAFETKAEFNNWGQARLRDKHVVNVPESDPVKASKYKIVAGFILSPEELEYNRDKTAGARQKTEKK